ncbi:MAG: MerR family transcriptional regulator [Candidatus Nephthysia bennettiae]|uniref:MerR family transcriptional regulator n=1 Tax=Candidatus Nephthysia bennettiae TaxID=3127016 RepID=A0A934K296_9BACT|nr:MerR family transcriptional regulator [Candidatus Dormibacteraeota bacterium]MBJ7613911.1 MerR family transcriptional regulator [Candidatus Dormibacteraeota bacterium]PZR91748.1 MAG: MerR family transcriptional regulator [Candidatus Dormibacteraeota bacterium]
MLSIGAFARRSRLSMKALRLYDRLGLLTPTHVDQGSGYRWYRESQLPTARLVAMLRRLDMPLTQVAKVISAAGPRRAELVASYWDAVERRIASQRELAAHLRIRLSGEERSFRMFEIQQRDVPEQTVLTDRRHLLVDELPNWIAATMGRLLQSAEGYGGVVSAPFVVYHGEVNQDSDGPVEVCVPVGAAPHESTGSAIRSEPVHSEAYVRLTKAQVEYPQILSAYDAVAQWIGSNGRAVSGSPREVYFADWNAAGPGDEVCDVAFPMR